MTFIPVVICTAVYFLPDTLKKKNGQSTAIMKSLLRARYHNILHYGTPGLNTSLEIPSYGKRYVDCTVDLATACVASFWAREHNGAQGVPSPHLRDPIFTKKNPEPSTWKPAIHSVESRIQDQWRIQERGPVDPAPPYFYTKLRPEGPKKIFLRPGPPLLSGSEWPDPPPFVRVWMTGPPLPPLYKGLVPPLKTTDYSETEKVTL